MDAKTTTVPGQLFRLEQLDTDLEQRTASLADMQARQRANPELAAAQMRLATVQKQEAETAARQRSLKPTSPPSRVGSPATTTACTPVRSSIRASLPPSNGSWSTCAASAAASRNGSWKR